MDNVEGHSAERSAGRVGFGNGAGFGAFGGSGSGVFGAVGDGKGVEPAVGRVFVVGRRGKAKRRAEYRRVGRYYKGIERYQLERSRRRQVLLMHWEGLTLREIAVKLRVSERTVKRDFARVKPYFDRKLKRYLGQLADEERAEVLRRLEGLGASERLAFLEKLLGSLGRPAIKAERGSGRIAGLSLTVDADAALAGRAALWVEPASLLLAGRRLRVDVVLKMQGRTLKLGNVGLKLR